MIPGSRKTTKVRTRNDIGCLSSVAALALLATSCFSQTPVAANQLFTATHKAMGTVYTLSLYSPSQPQAEAIEQQVFDEIDRIDALLSNYQPASELSRINQNAGRTPVTTDEETMRFLLASQHWSLVSNGAFDITVGRLMKLWGFYRHQGAIPSDTELEKARASTGWQKLQLDASTRTVRFLDPGIELDPGGIGKGFAVDAAVALLRDDHVPAAMISAGGSTIYALGAPPGEPGWKIVVPGPLPSNATLSSIYLRDTSLSSSDCSQKNFVANGHLYCHIMDPRTLRPVEGRVQVTIIDPSATASDALSNVLFVDNPDESLRVLQHDAPEARALVVSSTTDRKTCTAFRWTAPIDTSHCTLQPSQGQRSHETEGKVSHE
ncbi:thiamine biosynthesis lipoprotein [Bryocella elongata]|uniref:FAD:protein FMN transferase n=1 Tax=Bryocella elongata TaxID=863522 RepID=A0A1H6CHG3_9BACT|nr:FAD:protein FMN transferase [Bryocella elongata]SEG72227.1 thiamine biosynthesis lipoprotein [Bryocella elongata]